MDTVEELRKSGKPAEKAYSINGILGIIAGITICTCTLVYLTMVYCLDYQYKVATIKFTGTILEVLVVGTYFIRSQNLYLIDTKPSKKLLINTESKVPSQFSTSNIRHLFVLHNNITYESNGAQCLVMLSNKEHGTTHTLFVCNDKDIQSSLSEGLYSKLTLAKVDKKGNYLLQDVTNSLLVHENSELHKHLLNNSQLLSTQKQLEEAIIKIKYEQELEGTNIYSREWLGLLNSLSTYYTL